METTRRPDMGAETSAEPQTRPGGGHGNGLDCGPGSRIFDPAIIRKNRDHAAGALEDHDFLFSWCAGQFLDRLLDIRRRFPAALQMGLRTPDHFTRALIDRAGIDHLFEMDLTSALLTGQHAGFVGSESFLPLRDLSLDLIVSPLGLHCVDDLPGALIQIRRALRPDGLFLGALIGGQSLAAFRSCLMQAELEGSGGVTPRISPFADSRDMAGLMQRAGFALPVVDCEKLHVTYPDIFTLMRDLKAMGEGNALQARSRSLSGKTLFQRAEQLYRQNFADASGRLLAGFDIIFLSGWAPDQSQQRPLPPGSAETSLAEALGTCEHTAGDKACP